MILLIPAAEVRLLGADVIILNVTAEEVARLKNFDDVRRQMLPDEVLVPKAALDPKSP